MRQPSGILTVHLQEGKNLVQGKGKANTYAVISIGENQKNFQNFFCNKTVNPIWNYTATFLLEDWMGLELSIGK